MGAADAALLTGYGLVFGGAVALLLALVLRLARESGETASPVAPGRAPRILAWVGGVLVVAGIGVMAAAVRT